MAINLTKIKTGDEVLCRLKVGLTNFYGPKDRDPNFYIDGDVCFQLPASSIVKHIPASSVADVPSAVNHPKHYNSHPSGVECIDVVEHMSFNTGNAMKYLWRADEKGAAIEDLEKARWYIDREITKRKASA